MAVLALVALAAGIVSDSTNSTFWGRHALLAGLASSAIVVMLSVAVLNEVLQQRGRQRWTTLAQYIMFEFVRNARMIWSGILDVAGLLPDHMDQRDALDQGAEIVRDTARLTEAVRQIVHDTDRRKLLHDEVAFLAEHADEVLGRWAGVMLNAEVYAEVVDRHVELAGDIAWIGGLLGTSQPYDDTRRQRRARSNPSIQIASEDDDWLADRIVVITQLAERLDRGTLDVALQLVPVQWWQGRLSPSPPDPAVKQP